jgi:heptosyltransferase I
MRIAIVKLSALGDIVHALVVLQFIKKYNQSISIDWIVDERFEGLLKHQIDIANIHLVRLKKAKEKKSIFLFAKELYKLKKLDHYDVVIDMQGLIKSSIAAKIIPSKLTIGFDRDSAREILSSFLYNKSFKIDYSKNIILRNIELIEMALGFSITKEDLYEKKPFLYSNIEDKLSSLSSVKKNILLIPGSSLSSKCYPLRKLVKLTNLVNENFYIIWGDEFERQIAENIKKMSNNLNVIICDKTSLEKLISIVRQMDLVIGPDSGPTHMAWALNIPSITLFGSTPGYRNALSTEINKIVESDSKVNPYKINANDFSVGEIKVNEIIKLINILL